MFRKNQRNANSTYKKLAVQWLNEALCFVSSSVVADSLVLRNRQLLVAANRYAQFMTHIMKTIFILLTTILVSCGQQNYEHKNLNEIAKELNALCPKMVDDGTRWDKVTVSDNILELTFTLVNMDKDSTDTDGLTKEVKVFLINNLKKGFNMYKTQIDLNYIKQNNIVFHYVYVDKRNQVLSDIVIKPEDYNN